MFLTNYNLLKENAVLKYNNYQLGVELKKAKSDLKNTNKKIVFYKQAYKLWKKGVDGRAQPT